MQTKVYLRKKITNRIALGHPWIFGNEIGEVEHFNRPGQVVSVFSSNGSFVGSGYYNPASKIAIRLLSRRQETTIDRSFFLKKIKAAAAIRTGYLDTLQRIVAGEADFLPGLIVDKIERYLVFQIYTLGMERWKETIVSCLKELYPHDAVFEKNDGHFRKAENLPSCRQFWTETKTSEFIFENDEIKLKIDLENSPRTGMYWEQILLYHHLKPYFAGKRVLDAFAHHGLLVLGAQKNGAEKAVGLDWSETAKVASEKNCELNGDIKNIHFYTGNSFTFLQKWATEKFQFDLVILDPPALSGIGKKTDVVLSGYGKLIDASLKLLPPKGWILLSMSGHMIAEEILLARFHKAAQENAKSWRIIKRITQGVDHPILWNIPATKYFQAWLLLVEEEI